MMSSGESSSRPFRGQDANAHRSLQSSRQRRGGGRDDEDRRLRSPARTVPFGVAGVLLPDARLGPRRRGPGPGHVPEGVAGAGSVRRDSQLAAHLALPDRDERLPDRVGGSRPPAAAVGAGGRVGPARAARPGRERRVAPALAGLVAGRGRSGRGRDRPQQPALGVRRRPAAPVGTSARRADPA